MSVTSDLKLRDNRSPIKELKSNKDGAVNLIGAQKRSGFVATLLTLTAFGRAIARRDSLRESLNLHLLT